jgi:hypothetical protein
MGDLETADAKCEEDPFGALWQSWSWEKGWT